MGLDKLAITRGFWKTRQEVNRKVSLELLWQRATNNVDRYALSYLKLENGELIPYNARNNREEPEMSFWLSLSR